MEINLLTNKGSDLERLISTENNLFIWISRNTFMISILDNLTFEPFGPTGPGSPGGPTGPCRGDTKFNKSLPFAEECRYQLCKLKLFRYQKELDSRIQAGMSK